MLSPTVLGSGLAGYDFLRRTREEQQEVLARSPQVARQTQHVLAELEGVTSAEDLLGDYTLLKVALGAFGLDEDIGNRAFLRQVLESDLSDRGSLANRLADKRYLAFARAFDFAGGTPSLDGMRSAAEVGRDLAAISDAADLLDDPALLRASLRTFGLEGAAGLEGADNRFFLKQVLESDLADPASFANRLSDPRYAEFSAAFGLGEKLRAAEGFYGFVDRVAGRIETLREPADLLEDEALLGAALRLFGLEDDAGRSVFLEQVLASDLSDPASVANRQEDPRYAALANLFDFAARDAARAAGEEYSGTLERAVQTVAARSGRIAQPGYLFRDIGLMLTVFEVFDLPTRPDGAEFANRILISDREKATSLINIWPDPRYRAFADAFTFEDPDPPHSYPPGFAEAVVQNYIDRQFEIRVGETDPSLRIALTLERDLAQAAAPTSENSRWFSVMASKPLRQVFETVFGLPAGFGTLDVDRQREELSARAAQMFGSSDVADFLQPDRLEELRRRYLAQSSIASTGGGAQGGGVVASLLAGALWQ
ncbi:DUF1217 domain-containing protein [Aquicoccus sp. SCR17]|nr:DUF1217 domain-containing protein [Carideicomes alvinocaridis]